MWYELLAYTSEYLVFPGTKIRKPTEQLLISDSRKFLYEWGKEHCSDGFIINELPWKDSPDEYVKKLKEGFQ